MWKGLKSILGLEPVVDTAMNIINRIAGTDWTPEKKAEFIDKFMQSTKHQSPVRRIIACTIVAEQFLLMFIWMVSSVFGRLSESAGALLLAGDMSNMLGSDINITLNIIIGFYFASHLIKK